MEQWNDEHILAVYKMFFGFIYVILEKMHPLSGHGDYLSLYIYFPLRGIMVLAWNDDGDDGDMMMMIVVSSSSRRRRRWRRSCSSSGFNIFSGDSFLPELCCFSLKTLSQYKHSKLPVFLWILSYAPMFDLWMFFYLMIHLVHCLLPSRWKKPVFHFYPFTEMAFSKIISSTCIQLSHCFCLVLTFNNVLSRW